MAIKYGIKEVADITFIDLATNKPILFLDTLKVTSIENKADTSYARGGKGNPKLLGWDFNREATMKVQDALMSLKSISMMTGNDIVTGVTNVYKREVLKTTAGSTGNSKVTLAKTPIANSVTAYKLEDDGTGKPELAIASSATTSVEFLLATAAVGVDLVVYYQYATTANSQTITISADKFPAYVKVVGDTVVRNAVTGQDEAFQIIIHKAKIMPNFTLTFQADGEPTVFDMDMDIFRRDIDTEMIEMIKYEV